jgi:hypothetical protein
MAINSVGAKVSTGMTAAGQNETRLAAQKAQAGKHEQTIADHVAAVDDHEPIRSASTTRGTLVDTYL